MIRNPGAPATMIRRDDALPHEPILQRAIVAIDRMLSAPVGILDRRIPDFDRGDFHDDHMRRLSCGTAGRVDAIHLSGMNLIVLKFLGEDDVVDSAIEFPYQGDMTNDARGTLKLARHMARSILDVTATARDDSVAGAWPVGLAEIARSLGSEWVGITMPTPWSRLRVEDDAERYALLPRGVRNRIERACPRAFSVSVRPPTEKSPGDKLSISAITLLHPDPHGARTDPIDALRSIETVLRLSGTSADDIAKVPK